MIHVIRTSPFTIGIGVLFGLVFVVSVPAIYDVGREQYESIRPVISNWKVLSEVTDGNDISISGTMVKGRDCLLVPPVIARDMNNATYQLETPRWSAKDASPLPQPFGPWKVIGGAGKKLKFTMVYLCGGAYPTIVHVGTYGGK